MSIKSRKKLILAAVETTYGVQPSLVAANAILVKDANISPCESELVSRDLQKPYLGNSESLIAAKNVKVDFVCELVGAGVIGKIPGFDPLLRACGLVATQIKKDITITSATGTATATLAAHGFKVGDKVLVSGVTEIAYNGEKTITAITTDTFSFAVSGNPDSPATGSPKVATEIKYLPVSESFESITLHFNIDGVEHAVKGARGSFEMSIAAKQIPSLKFTFTGLYVAPADVAQLTPDYDSFGLPQIANTANTPGFSLFGFSTFLESMTVNMSNDIQHITLIGKETIELTDRKPSGSIVFEAPRIAEKDFFALIDSQEQGPFVLNHGTQNGFKVEISAPAVLLGNPSYQDNNGVQMLSVPFTPAPTDAGNDEIKISFT